MAALGACEDMEFRQLFAAMEWIAENPRHTGHTRRALRDGRPVELVRIGAFDIAFHADHAHRHV